MRANLGEYNFAGQYQRSPAPLDGGLVKRDWLRFYEPGGSPDQFYLIFQPWDTANKPTELSDFSVCTIWCAKGGHLHLLNMLRQKLDFPGLKRAALEQQGLFRATVVIIEDKAAD